MHVPIVRTFLQSLALVAMLALMSTGGISCAGRDTPQSGAGTSPARDGAVGGRKQGERFGEHWVQDAKVRALMQQIARGTASWPQGVPDDPESAESPDLEPAFADAAVLADALASAASQIPNAVAERRMTKDARERFIEEAESLHRQALELKEAAGGKRVEQMQRTLDRINTTCFACHSQFRDLTGDLNLNRARLNEPANPPQVLSFND
jgi:hypothetical protein